MPRRSRPPPAGGPASSGPLCRWHDRPSAAPQRTNQTPNGVPEGSPERDRLQLRPGAHVLKQARAREAPSRCRLVVCEPWRPRHRAALLGEGLSDPREPRRSSPTTIPRPALEDPWRALGSVDYYRLLTGREPRRDGMVRCSSVLHEDRHPSARLYPGPDRGWYCFACGARFAACAGELRRMLAVVPPRGVGAPATDLSARRPERPRPLGSRPPCLEPPGCPASVP